MLLGLLTVDPGLIYPYCSMKMISSGVMQTSMLSEPIFGNVDYYIASKPDYTSTDSVLISSGSTDNTHEWILNPITISQALANADLVSDLIPGIKISTYPEGSKVLYLIAHSSADYLGPEGTKYVQLIYTPTDTGVKYGSVSSGESLISSAPGTSSAGVTISDSYDINQMAEDAVQAATPSFPPETSDDMKKRIYVLLAALIVLALIVAFIAYY